MIRHCIYRCSIFPPSSSCLRHSVLDQAATPRTKYGQKLNQMPKAVDRILFFSIDGVFYILFFDSLHPANYLTLDTSSSSSKTKRTSPSWAKPKERKKLMREQSKFANTPTLHNCWFESKPSLCSDYLTMARQQLLFWDMDFWIFPFRVHEFPVFFMNGQRYGKPLFPSAPPIKLMSIDRCEEC